MLSNAMAGTMVGVVLVMDKKKSRAGQPFSPIASLSEIISAQKFSTFATVKGGQWSVCSNIMQNSPRVEMNQMPIN